MCTATQPSTKTFRRMVEAAILAPSPDNNQPWRFTQDGERLTVYLDTSRTLPSDVQGMFDLTGIGAAIENACLVAQSEGLAPQVQIADQPCVNQIGDRPVATITLQPGGRPDALVDQIPRRHSNRQMYSRRPVPEQQLDQLSEACEPTGCRLDWITDRSQMRALGGLVASCDSLRFQYKPFHEELFRQLRFSAAEAERTRDGLDVRTLALPPGAVVPLKLLGGWGRMRALHKVGLGGLLTLPTHWSVRRSGAIGAISVDGPGIDRFVSAGRALQRVWLAATGLGLAIHPLGSLPIYYALSVLESGGSLSAAHQQLLERVRVKYGQIVPGSEGRLPTMLFRIGSAKSVRTRSLRRPIDEIYTTLTSDE